MKQTGPVNEDIVTPLRGAPQRVVANMETSLTVPTATSVRAVPAKLLIDNRVVINNHLARSRGGKVKLTHLIGYAMVKALAIMPAMNNGFTEKDGRPALLRPAHVNFGLAIDLQKEDGSRTLVDLRGFRVRRQHHGRLLDRGCVLDVDRALARSPSA